MCKPEWVPPDEPGSTFACSFDGAAFAACTSPLQRSGLAFGDRFRVRATDALGNTDPTPAGRDWTVTRPSCGLGGEAAILVIAWACARRVLGSPRRR